MLFCSVHRNAGRCSAIADCDNQGRRLELPYFLGLLADAHLAMDKPEMALEHLTRALQIRPAGRGYYYEAELHRLSGQALAMTNRKGRLDAARAAFEQALSIAHAQSAQLLALRSATA